MPPRPGMFAVPYNATHKSSNQNRTEYQTDGYHQQSHSGSHQHQTNAHAGSSRAHGAFCFRLLLFVTLADTRPIGCVKESDSRRDKKRREFAGRLGKEMIERRDEYVLFVIS